MYKTDFIQLSDVLFKSYRALSHNELDKVLSKNKLSKVDVQEIKKFLPKSNWERYFSAIIEYDESRLKDKWRRLYELRNDVAHNRHIDKAKFGKIRGLTSEIKQVIEQAIEALDSIDLKDEDKENIIISYQPDSIAARSYFAEKAVGDWYLRKYSIRELSSADFRQPFDFSVLLDDDRKIAVEVKLFARNVAFGLKHITDRVMHQAQRLILDSEISEFHIVLVARDPDSLTELQWKRVMERITKFKESLPARMIVIVGHLDSDSEFVRLDV